MFPLLFGLYPRPYLVVSPLLELELRGDETQGLVLKFKVSDQLVTLEVKSMAHNSFFVRSSAKNDHRAKIINRHHFRYHCHLPVKPRQVIGNPQNQG